VKKGIQAAATNSRGQGVDERVAGQASAGVGATRMLYHIIRLQRGARVGNCSGKAVEEAKLEGWSQRCSSPGLSTPTSWSRTQSWGKAEVATARQDVKRVTCLMRAGWYTAKEITNDRSRECDVDLLWLHATPCVVRAVQGVGEPGFRQASLRPAGRPVRSERSARARDRERSPIIAAQRAVTNAHGVPGPCKGSCSRFLDDASKDQLVEA
jgi:hypothetical protein